MVAGEREFVSLSRLVIMSQTFAMSNCSGRVDTLIGQPGHAGSDYRGSVTFPAAFDSGCHGSRRTSGSARAANTGGSRCTPASRDEDASGSGQAPRRSDQATERRGDEGTRGHSNGGNGVMADR